MLVYAPRGWGRGLRPESAAWAPVTDPVRSGTWLSQEEGLGKGCGFGPGSREGLGSGLLAVGKQGAVRRRLRDPCPGPASWGRRDKHHTPADSLQQQVLSVWRPEPEVNTSAGPGDSLFRAFLSASGVAGNPRCSLAWGFSAWAPPCVSVFSPSLRRTPVLGFRPPHPG